MTAPMALLGRRRDYAAIAANLDAGAASSSAWKSNGRSLSLCMVDVMVVLFIAHAPLSSRSQLLTSRSQDSCQLATR